jgi:murein DD-endopeptidase MepM/ murein hydrolase activator NlpD
MVYMAETINAHNLTRAPGEPRITDYQHIPVGTELIFYPPLSITNKHEKSIVPVYRFFMDMIGDPYPYVTGDWCERGMGGNQPHYAIDVAGAYGSEIISPVDGIAALKTDPLGGRTVAVKFDDAVISFSHLDKRHVKDGDTVKQGMLIGTIGMTGRTSGPHAHISYGIRSLSRHDITFGRDSYRLTDPKHLFYKMAYAESVDE